MKFLVAASRHGMVVGFASGEFPFYCRREKDACRFDDERTAVGIAELCQRRTPSLEWFVRRING